MKKVVSFGLCFLIVLCSFVICFADVEWSDGSGSPSILPVSDSPSFDVELANGTHLYYSSDSVYPVYIVAYNDNSILLFSDVPNTVVNYTTPYGSGVNNLTSQYNGYYYASSISNQNIVNIPILEGVSSPSDVIDFVNNTVFKTTFDLSSIVGGSVSWVSSMAQAVKNNGLLLFFVLVCFVGIGIGLFRRFVNG